MQVGFIGLGHMGQHMARNVAAAGHAVTGVDPAAASLAAARAKPGADRVRWLQGTAGSAPDASFDVALMTSHVAQCFVDDAEWTAVLLDCRRALVAGGRLAFDSRDPEARAWRKWNPRDSRRVVTLDGDRKVETWVEVTAARGDTVSFTRHYRFPDGERSSESTLRFRSEARLRESLGEAGFTVEQVYGGWLREPVGAGDGELIVVARTRRR
jgi:SAM-dependent methyltransferase